MAALLAAGADVNESIADGFAIPLLVPLCAAAHIHPELHHRTKDVADARNIHTTPLIIIVGVGSAITAPITTPDDVLKHLCQAGLAAAC